MTLRSPVPWMGGKHYSAHHIISAFPSPANYDVYVDLFGGAAHVLIQKPPYKHVEVYNDINNDLVNFWMQCRDNAQALEASCRTLPYARSLYYAYHRSLFDGTQFTPTERAVRWFYTLRSNFSGQPLNPSPNGWSAGLKDARHGAAGSYHGALDLLESLQVRLRRVLIDNRDFEGVFKQYDSDQTLFYIDPPYLDCEHYYQDADGATFSLDDHKRLASVVSTSSAYIAISYYPHPLLDDLYPTSKWRRVTWKTPKHSQRTQETHTMATEMLLLNYAAPAQSLWTESEASA